MSEDGKDERRRPYAAPSNVISVIQRARTRNLPDSIDDDFLALANIPPVVNGRVLEALKFLDLINKEDQSPTDRLRALAASSDEEYPQLLEGAVREAYATDFQRVNPSEESQAQIQSAFRIYNPRSQINRMVILFLGLCREANIPVKQAPRQREMSSEPRPSVRTQAKSQGAVRNGHGTKRAAETAVPQGTLFGVSERDIALLNEEDFNEVWSALGKVARARSLAIQMGDRGSKSEDDTEDDTKD